MNSQTYLAANRKYQAPRADRKACAQTVCNATFASEEEGRAEEQSKKEDTEISEGKSIIEIGCMEQSRLKHASGMRP